MRITVKKTIHPQRVDYKIIRPNGIVIRKEIGRLVISTSLPENLVKGGGTLFEIPGYRGGIHIGTPESDRIAISKDWSRVGQSIYDGTLVLFKK